MTQTEGLAGPGTSFGSQSRRSRHPIPVSVTRYFRRAGCRSIFVAWLAVHAQRLHLLRMGTPHLLEQLAGVTT
jgi:hypothetical protein